jgi:DNA replication and repair protein RecF
MRLNQLVLRNFRSYADCEIEFTDRVNLIIGENAQGKTTLLEAIYFLSTAKSHRTYPDNELIRHNESWFYLKGEIAATDGAQPDPEPHDLQPLNLMTVEVSNELSGKKRFKFNGTIQQKLSQWIGQFNVVFFSPESLTLVKGAPADRRRFIDLLISQINSAYLNSLQNYQFALKQRNELLKQIRSKQASPDFLDPWDDILIAEGISIIQTRVRMFDQLKAYVQAKHAELTGKREILELKYQPSPEKTDEAIEQVRGDPSVPRPGVTGEATALFRKGLRSARSYDILRGMTSVGPHRDDFKLILEAQSAGAMYFQEAKAFGSQGQQRTIALALKLGELELIRETTGKTPIVLLDDVFSELDEGRSSFLFSLLGRLNAQTFITSTRQEAWVPELGECRVFTVHDGQVN